VHKILLNSVLLPPIGSGGIRPKLPRQTPLGHNSPCFFPLEDRLGSGRRLVGRIGSGVRVSVSFRQKYPPGSVLRCPTKKNRRFHVPQPTFLFPRETPLRISRNMLQRWKGNSMLAKPLAACTHLSSTISQLFESQVQKIAVFTYCSPQFCFPWRRHCDYDEKCCIDGKTIQCLSNGLQHVPIYLQKFPSYTMLKSMRKSKNRRFYHIFVSPGDAPGAITLNVAWVGREFDAYKLPRCICPSSYNRF